MNPCQREILLLLNLILFFSSRRRHTSYIGDWSRRVLFRSGGPMHRVPRGLSGSVLLLLLISATASAQQGSAQISGTVKDSQGGVIPGADVTATQIETGF